MPDQTLVPLSGSERAPLATASPAGDLDPAERAELTLVLRRRATLPHEIVTGPTVLTNGELAERYGADPADADLVARTLTGLGLEVTAVAAGSRRIKVAGTLGALSAAFGVTLQRVSSTGPGGQVVTHRYREGTLYVPAALDGIVLAVLGLDTRPQFRAHFRARDAGSAGPAGSAGSAGSAGGGAAGGGAAAPAAGISYPPSEVASLYGFPAGTTGAGQTIAVIELGGGFSPSDLAAYFGGLGLPVPSISAVSVDGASNAPGSDPTGADIEVNLDVDVIGAAAPGAKQVVYFAPNNGDQGFVDAISEAMHASPVPIAISISWGQSEDTWTAQGRAAMDAAMADAAALGITVCVAAGDNGSGDAVTDGQQHADFPASSPHALGCGGTKLLAKGNTIGSEVVWNEIASGQGAGGGGVSDLFALPSWQATAGVPARAGGTQPGTKGRGVPDVAGNADPTTGYQVYVDGKARVVGGTSAVAPLWAALVSRLAEATGKRFGMLQPILYKGITPGHDVAGFHDITSGNNGSYTAGRGWDACTGLGTPNGAALLKRLRG
jgi:kumamolisin